jgi:hypothetical protein
MQAKDDSALSIDYSNWDTVFPRSFDHHSVFCMPRLPPEHFLYRNLVDPTTYLGSALLYIFKAA